MNDMTTFDSFRPSFLTLGAGAVRDLFERAYKDGASHIQRKEETTSPENGTLSHEGVVRGELSFSNLRHGHYPAAATGIPSELSGFAPFRLSATYKDGALEEVTLELFLLNPRFLISETRWYPASFAAGRLTPLTGEPAPWGVFLAGDGSQAAEALRKGLPSKTLPESRGASLRREYDENTILGRLDLSMKWSTDKLGQAVADHFGRIPGIPNASPPEGLEVVSLQFFSPEVDHGFDALLSAGKTFGIRLPTGADATPLFLVEGRKDEKPDEETAKCLTALGLPADFQGLVFKGIEAFLLSDNLRQDAAPLSVKLGVSAIATGDAPGTSYRSRLLAEYTPPAGHGAQKAKARGVTSWLRSAQLDAILDDTGLSVSLSGTFGELDGLFGWLSNRRAQIFWRDLPGSDPIYAIEVEQAEDGDMVSLTPDTLGMSQIGRASCRERVSFTV